MRALVVSMMLVAALYVLRLGHGHRPLEVWSENREASAESAARMLAPGTGSALAAPGLETLAEVEQAQPSVVLPSQGAPGSAFFPEATVVATWASPVDEDGYHKVVKTLETDLTHPFVRLVETYAVEGELEVLQSQVAMVANQLLLQRPENVSEAFFLSALQGAGAIEVRPVGAGYLATFEARPTEPNALDFFRDRVREAIGTEAVVEPNYIRKLI